jgi:hypothetical protein
MSPTIGKELHRLTNNGSNFNNNITTTFRQQQHHSNYSTSAESSPDDSLGDFEGTDLPLAVLSIESEANALTGPGGP